MKNEKSVFRILYEISKQGRLYSYPLGLLIVLAGIASHTVLTPVLVMKSVLLSFLLSFVAFAPNEYYDRDIDSKLERKKLTGNIVSDENLGYIVAWGSIVLAVLTSFFLSDFAAISLLAVSAASVLYSVPPVRLKGRAPLDGLTNGVGLFFIFALGVGISGGTLQDVIPGAYWFSFIFTFYHGISAIPDMEQDRKEGLRTMPMLVGKKSVLILSQAAAAIALIFENFSPLSRRLLVLMVVTPVIVRFYIDDEKEMSKLMIVGMLLLPIYLAIYTYTRGIV